METRSSAHSSAIICSSSSIHLDSGLIQVDLRIQQTLDFDYSENDRFRHAISMLMIALPINVRFVCRAIYTPTLHKQCQTTFRWGWVGGWVDGSVLQADALKVRAIIDL